MIKDELSWMNNLSEEAREHFNEIVESNIYDVNEANLKDREVIDIGANIGTFSIFASKLGAKKVIAVEPVSSTFDIFKRNIGKAQVSNVFAFQNIASSKTGEFVRISLQKKSGHNSAYLPSDYYEEIPTIAFKDLVGFLSSDDIFLKMDCEGGEYDILLNADPEDMKRISTVAIEIHGDLHPVHKGIELMRNKLASFGLKPIKQVQIGCWDGITPEGMLINYRDLPITQETWVR